MKLIGCRLVDYLVWSPSVWRVWIEILENDMDLTQLRSPSVWRVWIEIYYPPNLRCVRVVTLRVEGVD